MARRRTLFLLVLVLLLSISTADASGGIAWANAGGPTGGSINVIALASSSPGMMYIGTNGGVFLTRDDGTHWQAASNGLPDNPEVTALVVTRDSNIAFAGTHSGIYRTRDAGISWTLADPRLADELIISLLIDPQDSNVLYAGTSNTLFKSANGGDAWNDVAADLKSGRIWSLAMASDGTLYSATDGGIYVSRNRGVTWQSNGNALPEGARPQAIVITLRGLLIGTTQGIFKSNDNKTWSRIGGELNGALPRPLVNDAQHPDRVFGVVGQAIIKTTDGGNSWYRLPNPMGTTPILSFAPGDKNTLYVGTARGVLKGNDEGANWQLLNDGLYSTSIQSMLLVNNNSSALLAATRYGLYRSADHGATWTESRGLTDPYVLSLARHPQDMNQIYAGTWSGSVFISQDGGVNFTRAVENLANNAPVSSLLAVRLPDNNPVLYAGTLGNGLFKGNEHGQNWTPQSKGFANATRITTLAFAPPSIVYAGTERGLFRTDIADPAAEWQLASAELPIDEVGDVQVDPNQPKMILVAFVSNGLFRSEDSGAHWKIIGQGSFATRVRLQAIAFNPGSPGVLYVGTDRGIYRSSDNGASWNASNEGLPPNADVRSILVDAQAANTIFAGTNNNSVIRGIDSLQASSAQTDWRWFALMGTIALGVVGSSLGYLGWRVRVLPGIQTRRWQGEWLQWEPAIKNALQTFGEATGTNLGQLPSQHLTRALQQYQFANRDEALSLQTSPIALKLDTFQTMRKFSGLWKAAWEVTENEIAFQSVTRQIVEILCAQLGFTLVEERAYRGVMGYVVRAPALRLKVPPRFPIVFIPRHSIQQSVDSLPDFMNILNMVGYFALIVDLRNLAPQDSRTSLRQLLRKETHDFIILDGNALNSILMAHLPAQRLVDIILSQVDLTVVSPYVTSGPVPNNMFFGREYEIKTVVRTVRDTNFAFVGGRKIGKTSVLTRLRQQFKELPDYKALYLDCQATYSHADFFKAIETMWNASLPEPTPEGFRRFVTDLSVQQRGHTIVMLLDEIDALLKYDIEHGEHLFRIIRALAQELPVRFVFCGERVLSAALHNPAMVFFNFCNLMQLSFLSRDDARRVVTDPMQEMGITLEKGSMADQIVELAACHPNLVQYICQKLIERINDRRERLIRQTDLTAINESAQFAEYAVEICWGGATPLEQLVTLLMLDRPETTLPEMAAVLHQKQLSVSPAELDDAFKGLSLLSTLQREGIKYAFATRAFPMILRRSQDVTGLIDACTSEIKRGNGAKP